MRQRIMRETYTIIQLIDYDPAKRTQFAHLNKTTYVHNNIPSFDFSVTSSLCAKLTSMLPCFVTAFSFPDTEPTEMSPSSTSTSVTPEKRKTNSNLIIITTIIIIQVKTCQMNVHIVVFHT